MTSLSDAAAPKTAAAKRNQSSMETVSDVTVPTWKARSKAGKLGQKKG
jgi:hypothetical protein